MSRKQKKNIFRIVAALVLLIAAMLLPLNGIWRLAAFVLPYLLVGYDVLFKALRNMIRGQVFDEQFLMTIATIGAFALGKNAEAVAVMLFYQVGEWFQSVAVGKSRRSIAALMDIRPDTATVLREGQELAVSPEEVLAGETIVIRPGERIPLDGVILQGVTSVNTAALTGESLPADKETGDSVVSGSVNLTGVITVKVQSAYQESTVARILTLMEESSSKKAQVEGFITRFARVYTPCVVLGALLLFLIPTLIFGGSLAEWGRRALVFLVVSCPCALVVSVPLSFFGGIGGASRQGILVKGANYMELLSKMDTCVFDKTGTLTKGQFAVYAVHPCHEEEAAMLDMMSALESYSSHPIAVSIVSAHASSIDKSRFSQVQERPGEGLTAMLDGEVIAVGNGKLMNTVSADWKECHLPGTAVHIARGSQYLGHVVVSDVVKAEAAEAISALKKLGVSRTVMLTGDRREVAQAICKETGVDDFRAELMPQDKVTGLESLLEKGRMLAFVGDGINDAPALSRADLGIAMGAMGSDAAIEAADVVLMDDKLTHLPKAVSIARKTMSIVRQNIVFAIGVKLLVLLLAAVGLADMWIAVFADVGVMILAILNAMRTLKQ